MNQLSVAIVGATGAVGRQFLQILEERRFPIRQLRVLASARSAGSRLRFAGDELVVEEAREDSFSGVDLVFTTATAEVSRQLAPAAVAAGAVVVDDGSAFRMDAKVPLVVPEVNAGDVDWHEGILSTPNCSTVPLVMALWPVHRDNPVRRVVVSTYQAVSGSGAAAVEELRQQTRQLLDGTVAEPSVYPHQIAFNALPQIDSFADDGYTKEEIKMANETRKIMHAPELAFSATCVRIPVYDGHSEAVNAEFERPVEPAEFRAALETMPGLVVTDQPGDSQYPMPITAAGRDEVFVGRIRRDNSHPGGITFWLSCDNLRKGAALNAIQIAETLLERQRI